MLENKLFSVYKSKGPTSNQILNKIRKILNTKKVGHAGTLDPLASGVLVVGVGREANKKLGSEMQKEKEYIAKIKLGENSTTYDAEGDKTVIDLDNSKSIDLEKIKTVLKKFIGNIKQVPPIYSAIKVSGQEAYKLARRGQEVKLGARDVEIKDIEILNYNWPYLEIKVTTGSGVYIRSLAYDIGGELGVGAYLAELERTRVGEFNKDNSITVDNLEDFLSNEFELF